MALLSRPRDSSNDPPGSHYGKVLMYKLKQLKFVVESHHLSHSNCLRHRVSKALLKAHTVCLRADCETNLRDGKSLPTGFKQRPFKTTVWQSRKSTSSILNENKEVEASMGRFEEPLSDPVFQPKLITLMIEI